jgi:glycosyltransferase involved in cell wall biosynthesis
VSDTPSTGSKFSPILGLPIDDEPVAVPGPTHANEPAPLQLSVIIPARNEEQNLPGCLASLLAQSEPGFALGSDWELIVVDDASTDATRSLAAQSGVTVLEAPPLELRGDKRGFTGKTNACWHGAQNASGRWLLFTDADTLHEPGDLRRALHEAEKYNVALLSYSPRQIVHGMAQHALMPLIFSELATVYPPAEVNDPARRTAAANGQFLLVERDAYFGAGGHRAVGRSVLEDVDLAWNALSLAAWRPLDILLLLLPLVFFVLPYLTQLQRLLILLIWARTVYRFYSRVARSNFGFADCALSVLGLPLFIVLLVRSWMLHKIFHQVAWKGREYRTSR